MKRSPNCCYCEKPHGKSFPLIFQSCDACQDARDKREIAASNGLVSVSCPRCDLMFSADATLNLTDAEREAIERGYCSLMGVEDMSAECTRWDAEAAAVLRGLLERTGGEK